MKSHRLAIGLLVSLSVAGIAAALRHKPHLFYPTPETESAFLKSYTPEHVIDCFREDQSYSYAQHSSAGAGTFVTHQAGFQFYVVLRREKWIPLMEALRDNVLQQLAQNRAEVLRQSGNSHAGFHFDYKINENIGSLTILPLALTPPSLIRRNISLPENTGDVTVSIEQAETWFPKGADTIQIGATGAVY